MSRFLSFISNHWRFTISAVVLALVAIAVIFITRTLREMPTPLEVSVDTDTRINLTPAQVTSIRRIGKWEFLSVQLEEIVDTTHKRMLLSDEQLIRIYRGTVRLGLDMSRLSDDWFTAHGDTAELNLPAIQSLDKLFIDEANTQTFYEAGSWDNKARAPLYRKAERQMKARLRSTNAYVQAQANAREQMTALMRSFGFRTVEISFEKRK